MMDISDYRRHRKIIDAERAFMMQEHLRAEFRVLRDAEKRGVPYLGHILCENGKDIRIDHYPDMHWFAVGLYTDMSNIYQDDLYTRLDVNNACEVIQMFLDNNRQEKGEKGIKCIINKILKLWHS